MAPTITTQGLKHVTSLTVDNGSASNTGTGYEFNSSQTLDCGTCVKPMYGSDAVGSPALMKVVNVAGIASAGSGGTTSFGGTMGVCTVSATPAQTALADNYTSITVTLTMGHISGFGPIVTAGLATNDTSPVSSNTYTESVTGCGALAGAALKLQYGVVVEALHAGTGLYSAPTCSSGVSVSSSDGATGLVLDCGLAPSTASWGTDNTAAFKRVVGNSFSLGSTPSLNLGSSKAQPICAYVPAGNYLTYPLNDTTSHPFTGYLMQGYGCWLGDEHYHSNIFVIPNTPGDVFAWMDSNKNSAQPNLGNTQTFSNIAAGDSNQAGASFRNITIIGDRLSTMQQNGLMFYGKTEFAYIDNVVVSYMLGRALGVGYPDNSATPTGDFNESRVQNLHFDHDGNGPSVPAFEITDSGSVSSGTTTTVDGSNQIDIVDLRIFQPFGTGLWIHSGSYASNVPRGIRVVNAKLESSQLENTQSGGDLFLIGDPTSGIGVADLLCRNLDLENPPVGFAALHIISASSANTGNIDCQGAIFGGNGGHGKGLEVDTCSHCAFTEAANTTQDYNLQIGTLTTTGAAAGTCVANIGAPGITYDGQNGESALTTCIDPKATGLLSFPQRQLFANSNVQHTYPAPPIEQISSSITASAGTTLTFAQTSAAAPPAAGSTLGVNITVPLWTLLRSGPTAPFSDSWDTAAAMSGAIGGYALPGQIYHLRICNQTAYLETIPSGGTNVSVAGSNTVPPGACTNFALVITAGGVTIVGG